MWVKYHFDAFIVHIITFVVLNQEHLQHTDEKRFIYNMHYFAICFEHPFVIIDAILFLNVSDN